MRRALAFLFGVLISAAEADACSIEHVFMPFVYPRGVFMLASATADSVFAGAGAVKWSLAEGHNGPTVDRPVYGQVVVVDSAAGPGARRGSRAVLVPWDYGPNCQPTPWGNSALWRRRGTEGLFTATLRDSAHWAGGLPTYDVFLPEYEPYTSLRGGTGQRGSSDPLSLLSAAELFAVARGLPVVRDKSEADSAAVAFLAWARTNRALSRRPPLNETVSVARQIAQELNLKRIDVPIRGTYRIIVVIGETDSTVFYARTFANANWPWDMKKMDRVLDLPDRDDPTRLTPFDAYLLGMTTASDSAGFIRRVADAIIYLPIRPAKTTTAGREWDGAMASIFIRQRIAGKPALEPYLATTLTVGADGAVSFEHRSRLSDGRSVLVRGVRISAEAYRND